MYVDSSPRPQQSVLHLNCYITVSILKNSVRFFQFFKPSGRLINRVAQRFVVEENRTSFIGFSACAPTSFCLGTFDIISVMKLT